ncbi:hypothetical protein BJY00DRAFT_141650 [Aspergillus carlsbadensis]|nr:hypothetical protein BJY00DRAFT_141650 [Aspergillus carlsbadensis]
MLNSDPWFEFTMTSPFLIREDSPYDATQRWYAPTPGNFNGSPGSPSNFSYIGSDYESTALYARQSQIPDKLPLLGLDDWHEGRAYNEQPPTCIHYSIEWKLALNKRVKTSDTEQNLVLAPSAYWLTLKPKLEKIISEKFLPSQQVQSDDTAITVAINDRSEHNLTKRFEKTNIEWSSIED